MTVWRLTVDREQFADALRRATQGVNKRSIFEVRLDKSDDGLIVAGLGITISLPASGSWPGGVLIPGATVKKLAEVLPNTLPFVIEINGQTLKIGTFSIGVKVLDIAPKRVDFVIEAKSRDIILAIARKGEPKVRSSVGAAMVERAKLELENAKAKAFHALEKFGATRQEIDALVESMINRQIS